MGGDLTAAAGLACFGFTAAAWTAIAELGTVLKAGLAFFEAWVPGVGSVRDAVVAMFAESVTRYSPAVGTWPAKL